MTSQRTSWRGPLAAGLVAASLLLIVLWAVNLYAAGVQVDAQGGIGRTRVIDVALPLLSITLFVGGLVVGRRERSRTTRETAT